MNNNTKLHAYIWAADDSRSGELQHNWDQHKKMN